MSLPIEHNKHLKKSTKTEQLWYLKKCREIIIKIHEFRIKTLDARIEKLEQNT